MIPTVAQIETRMQDKLDDPTGVVFTSSVRLAAISEAYDILWGEFLKAEAPRISNVAVYTLPAGTTVLTPATASIADFGELIELEERLYGSTDLYQHVYEVDKLPQRTASNVLGDFVWRLDSFYFVGATTVRNLRLSYYASGTCPATGSIGIDGVLVFMGNCAAAIAGKRKGYEEWQELWRHAVGDKYETGIIGGELYNLLLPIIRSKQRRPLQPRPFTMSRLPRRAWAGINIAAPIVGGTGSMPIDYTSIAGTVVGTIDGVNAIFFIPGIATAVEVIVGGITMAPGVGYNHSGLAIVFTPGYEPSTGSVIHVRAYL